MGSEHIDDGTTEARLAREAAFHDERFADDTRAATDKFYAITKESFGWYRERALGDLGGKAFLEYGCGPGSIAFDAATQGAKAVGIDISPVAVEQANARATGTGNGARFEVRNAEASGYADASFDRIAGSGILHHLDLDRAYRELARLLRPGGRGVFLEPLGHNPLINAYRKRTPQMRTEDEHPLLRADFDLANRYFASVRTRFFHLSSLAAVPLRGRPGFGALLAALSGIDRLLLASASPLRWNAWMAVVELER